MNKLKLIFVFSEKGGATKTTTSINLFGQLKKSGHDPVIFDCDDNGHAAYMISKLGTGNWLNGNVFKIEKDTTEKQILALIDQVENENIADTVIFDPPPTLTNITKILMKVAHRYSQNSKILVPVKASPEDILVTGRTIMRLKTECPDQDIYVLPSAIDKREHLSVALLSDFIYLDGIKLCNQVGYSADIKNSKKKGQTIYEGKFKSVAAQRVREAMADCVQQMGA